MRKEKWTLGEIVSLAILILGAVTMVLPFLWMVFTSLKDWGEIFEFPPRLLPKSFRWQNYLELFDMAPIKSWFFNSVFLSMMNVIGVLTSSTLAAYAFAVVRFKGRETWFNILLLTMMVPAQITMIPQYILFKWLGWINTLKPLWIPSFTGAPYMIFLLRQFYKSIPDTYVDAARIDGANHWQIFRKIFLPLSIPVSVTVALLTFINTWNYFLGPLIYLTDMEKMTMVSGLSFLQGQSFGWWNYVMAGSTLVVLPVILIFLVAQRKIIEGIMLQSGIKR